MKTIRIFLSKNVQIFGDEIFNIFEKASFRKGKYRPNISKTVTYFIMWHFPLRNSHDFHNKKYTISRGLDKTELFYVHPEKI